ncbi:hypothetical protein Leryth_014264 [Lithospermum erythrorhizon]|nr:hypothetical protein Leryth_014264 [Lithospermum erythrorhizon]
MWLGLGDKERRRRRWWMIEGSGGRWWFAELNKDIAASRFFSDFNSSGVVFRLVFAKHFGHSSATTLISWSNNITIDCHFNDIQLLVCKCKEMTQQSLGSWTCYILRI